MDLLVVIAALAAAMLISAALTWLLDRLWPDMAAAALAFMAGLVLPVVLAGIFLWIGLHPSPNDHEGMVTVTALFIGPIIAVFLMAFTVASAMVTIGWLRRPPLDDTLPR
jgi:hypothetical protein